MKTWRLITGVALVLLLGMLIGSAGTRLYLGHTHRGLHWRDRTARVFERLSRELDLSPEQKGSVRGILQDAEQKLRAHYLRQRPEAERIVDESFVQIRQLLNDEQKKKLDNLRERHRKRNALADQ